MADQRQHREPGTLFVGIVLDTEGNTRIEYDDYEAEVKKILDWAIGKPLGEMPETDDPYEKGFRDGWNKRWETQRKMADSFHA